MVGQIAGLAGEVDHGHHHGLLGGGLAGDRRLRVCLVDGQHLLLVEIDTLVGLNGTGLVIGTGDPVQAVFHTRFWSLNIRQLLFALELRHTVLRDFGNIVVDVEGSAGLLCGRRSCAGCCGGGLPVENSAQNSALDGGYQQSGQ